MLIVDLYEIESLPQIRALGYLRYDTDEELEVINELYEVVRVHTNFFLPSQKLIHENKRRK